MKRVIVIAAIGLFAGLAVGTTSQLYIMRPKQPLAVTDSAGASAPDSLGNETDGPSTDPESSADADSTTLPERVDSARLTSDRRGQGTPADSAPAPTLPAAGNNAGASAGGPTPILTSDIPLPAGGATGEGADSAGLPLPASKLGRIFAAMSPKDAARVLLQLDIHDSQKILGSLNQRQAAAILANFPADRAAELTRLSLHGKEGR